MDWRIDKSLPISRQIFEKLCVAIVSGEFKAGERILSVRELALLASVNPNTVQKSFEELERHGLIHSVPYSGWYVNETIEAAREEVDALKRKNALEYLSAMKKLGCNASEAISLINKIIEERTED